MITEDYVSFETAKLLKNKGFEDALYGDRTIKPFIQFEYSPSGKLNYFTGNPKGYPAPTLQMAMKWLRENYNIHIIGVPNGIGENVFYMGIYRKYDYGWTYISDGLDEEYKEAEFCTPEEACEAAIKYCLKYLIKP